MISVVSYSFRVFNPTLFPHVAPFTIYTQKIPRNGGYGISIMFFNSAFLPLPSSKAPQFSSKNLHIFIVARVKTPYI